MPNAYLQGITGSLDNQAQIRNDVSVVAINWYVNRCPLVTRVPRMPGGSTTFTMINRSYRSRTAILAANALAADTQITLADASALMNGDVLELASGERVELTADPNPITNVVAVRRGAEGTTPAAGASGDLIRLIGKRRGLSTEFLESLHLRRLGRSVTSETSAGTAILPPQLCHSLSRSQNGAFRGHRLR